MRQTRGRRVDLRSYIASCRIASIQYIKYTDVRRVDLRSVIDLCRIAWIRLLYS
jgi:hypothetical protein